MYLDFLTILAIVLLLVFFILSYIQAVRTDQVKSAESILESWHLQRTYTSHLPANLLNMLIVQIDNVCVGRASTIGGAINSNELSKVYNEGFAFNKFHSTVICSPIHIKFN